MALPAAKQTFTPQEYLRVEREAEYKSEYFAGEVFAMSGGTIPHSLIAMNVGGFLRSALKGRPCTPYNSDLRIAVSPDGLYTYPDVSVFCDPVAALPGTDDTATNPTVLVEVLSPSTEACDRGRKFSQCRQIASLRHYVLVSQDTPAVECFTLGEDGRWTLTDATGLDAVLPLTALGVDLPLAEVYEGVEFGGQTAGP